MLLLNLACAAPGHDGTYTLTLSDTTSDCASMPTGSPSLELTITETPGGDWRVAPVDEQCTARDDGFDCEGAAFDSLGDYGDVEAVVRVDLDLQGTWVAEGIEAVATYVIACEGAGCAGLDAATPERCSTAWVYR